MPTPRRSEAHRTEPRRDQAPAPFNRPAVVLPRRWLVTLMALALGPWILAGSYYAWNRLAAMSVGTPPAASAPATTAGGPWGRLTMTGVVVSPPLEYVATDWGPAQAPVWRFPNATADLVEAFLATAGLTADEIMRVRATMQPDARIGGVVARPDPELVRALDPERRARIYLKLAESPLNADQAHSFRFLATSSDQWLAGASIAPATRQLAEPLIYRDGGWLHFADLGLVRSRLDDQEEFRRLVKAFLRRSTVLVRLSIDEPSDIRGLAEYWGRGGRRTDLMPLLESIENAGPDKSIDIVHLLPVFARNHLYRYPRLTAADFDRPVIANCLWSALNFFAAEPDDRFLDVNLALATLKRDYYVIEHGFELGDIVAYLDDEGDIFHVAVYLADDLLFTKNGTSPASPWTIMSIDEVKGFYHSRSANPRLIYHRRNDF